MRILFAGSPELAVPSLVALQRTFPIAAVLTNPDRPVGRGKQPATTPVKQQAMALGLTVLQPQALDSPFLQEVRTLGADLLVVVAFGRIFRREFLDLFPQGGVNLHASLLPKYRGPSPIAAAILNGERETGVTVQRLALKMDAGDILGVRTVPLRGRETAGGLSDTLARVGAELLSAVLENVAQSRINPIRQNESDATYCRLVKKEDGRIDWSAAAEIIERMLRAYDPWPRAFTFFNGRRLNLLSGGVYPEAFDTTDKKQGLVLRSDNRYGILVNTGRGVLYVSSLQLQAKKPLDWRSFVNGQKDFIGAQLGE
ncbi:MAG: methionyl-tRNA formyltransferase [Spirochaetaceae bacterium]|nr:MAG: methionyl-tRNA formyltransferase [Spirochaetaceae bacterium]